MSSKFYLIKFNNFQIELYKIENLLYLMRKLIKSQEIDNEMNL
jgi:hypothetical protein